MPAMRLFVALLFWVTLTASAAYAQVSKISNPAAFGASAVRLDFEGLRDASNATSAYRSWGVEISATSPAEPLVRTTFIIGQTNNTVRNEDPLGNSANLPLTVNLSHPVGKIGFRLGNGTETTNVTLQAFDSLGTSLGTVQHTGASNSPFLGVSTTSTRGISKLVISYGAAPEAEELDDLTIEYLARPVFEAFLAQVGDGPIPGAGGLQTTIVVSNLSNSTAEGELKFFNDDGNALDVPVNGQPGNTFDFQIPAYSSNTFSTTGVAGVVVGYARITANVPVEATGLFRVLNTVGAVTSEAGVGSEVGHYVSVGVVVKATQGNFNSGIAAVNTGDVQCDGRIELYNESGALVASDESILDLPPRGHTAKFLSEIFPQMAGESFRGTVKVTGDTALALVILRTANGVVRSSLPVGTTEK